MGIANWMRVLETVNGLARMGGKLRSLTLDPGGPGAQGSAGDVEFVPPVSPVSPPVPVVPLHAAFAPSRPCDMNCW